MRDLVLSSVYGLSGPQIAPFALSLIESGFCGQRIMLALDVNEERDRFLAACGWEILPVNASATVHPFVLRFAVFREILSQLKEIRYVINADCRDVVFQKNPSSYLEENCPTRNFLCASEAIKLRFDPWATEYFSCNYRNEWNEMMDFPSYCAGTIAGGSEIMKELYGMIFRVAITGREHLTKPCDQPAFNILCNQELTNSRAIFATEEMGFAATCGTQLAPQFAAKLTEPRPAVSGAKVINSSGTQFCLVHQYERIEELGQRIVDCYAPGVIRETEKTGAYSGLPVFPSFRGNALSDRVAGKTVVIVGPSPSAADKGEEIDAADVVVRMNRALGEPGCGRTDILYHCLHESPECGGPIPYDMLAEHGITLCSPYPVGVAPFDVDVFRFLETNRKYHIPHHFIDREYYLDIAQVCGTRPNTGTSAIFDILAHRPKELRIYGFDFFRGGFRKGYKTLESGKLDQWMESDFNGNHHQEPQRIMIRDLCRRFPEIIKPDVVMKQILEQ